MDVPVRENDLECRYKSFIVVDPISPGLFQTKIPLKSPDRSSNLSSSSG